jgi:hypothetical protein
MGSWTLNVPCSHSCSDRAGVPGGKLPIKMDTAGGAECVVRSAGAAPPPAAGTEEDADDEEEEEEEEEEGEGEEEDEEASAAGGLFGLACAIDA